MAHAELGVVAVLGGSGRQGGGLARRLARAGVRPIVASRDPRRARATIQSWMLDDALDVDEYADAAARAQTIVLAVPFASIDDLLPAIGSRIADTAVVIDVTVPLTFAEGRVALAHVAEGSAAEHIRALLPSHVALACAFKTTPAGLLANLDAPLDCDEFVCGDSAASRARAAALAGLLPGLRVVDVGSLSRARAIEQMTALAIAINRKYKVHDARFRVVGI